ncbi:MAG TPA: hypothetical protein VLM78_07885 [Anaerolineales bacterium]|nr:hypothetical protein [Anaerolineales bacterium]
MKKLWLLFIVVVLLIAACAGPATPGGEAQVDDGDRNRSPLVQPTSPISVPPTPQPLSAVEDDSITTLRALIGERLRIAPAELTLVSVEQIIWPDASLGCPQPGMMYAQVLTPGWRVVFADATGRQYDIHTPEKLALFVLCTPVDELPKPLIPDVYLSNPAVEAAVKALVEREGVALESVSVVTLEAVEWSNSCLGCAQPGEHCLMVITPGYRIVLQSGEKTYTVHTNRNGRQAILCDRPESTPPRTDS